MAFSSLVLASFNLSRIAFSAVKSLLNKREVASAVKCVSTNACNSSGVPL